MDGAAVDGDARDGADVVVAGGQSGTEGDGNLPGDTTDVVGAGEVSRSFVQLGRLGSANLVRPFRQVYQEGRNGAPPSIMLYHHSTFSSELWFAVELPYREGRAELVVASDAGDAGVPTVQRHPGIYLSEAIDGARVEKVAIAGRVRITPTDEGLRVDLEDIVLRDGDGTSEEAFGDGVIAGELERVCEYLAIVPDAPQLDGMPYPQHVLDETWSSPFCAQYRSEAGK